MAANACWGVEVGQNALKAIKLVKTNDGVEVADWAVIPHKRVLSAPETDERDAKRVAVGTLVSQKDLSKATLAVSVSGSQAFARFAKLPPVEQKKIPDIVKFEAVQQIPFPIEDVEWDYQTFVTPDGAGGEEVEVGIFAMTRDRVQEKIDKWQDVGRTPDVMTLSPLAAYNALAYDMAFTESMPGTVLLDIGTTSTDLVVAEGGRLWIRTFPIGGHQFTEALVTAFNLSYVKAEKLKKEAENSSAARHVLQAMRPVFGDLAQDVQRSIGYYTSLHKDAKLTRLIGLGSTWHLPGLRKFLSQQLSLEVVRLESFQRVKVEGDKGAEFQEASVNLATAYGLALQGLGMQTIDANLIPLAATRKAVWAGKTKYFVGAAALLMLAGGASFVRPMMDSSAVAGAVRPASIDQVKQEAQRLKAEWTEIQDKDKPDPRAGVALDLFANREIYGHLLDDLGRIMSAADGGLKTPADQPAKVLMRSWNTAFRPPSGTPDASATGAAAFTDRPRIGQVLEITVALPESEADRFINQTVQKWLYDNEKRPGMPYFLDRESIKISSKGQQRLEAGGALGAVQAGTGSGPTTPTPGPGPRPPGPRNPGRNPFDRDREPPPPGRPAGEAGGPRPNSGGGNQSDLNSLAALPSSTPLGKEGDIFTTYVITWDAVMGAPTPTTAGGAK